MRLGPVLWDLLYNTLNENNKENIIKNIPYWFTELVETEPKLFHNTMKEVFGKTKKGNEIINTIYKAVTHKIDYEDFERKLEKKRQDIAILNDEYFTPEELVEDEMLYNETIKKPSDIFWNGGVKVKFRDCTKLNNNKEAQNGRCSQGAVDGVVQLVKENNSLEENIKIYIEKIVIPKIQDKYPPLNVSISGNTIVVNSDDKMHKVVVDKFGNLIERFRQSVDNLLVKEVINGVKFAFFYTIH
jgi:hypothetical protein